MRGIGAAIATLLATPALAAGVLPFEGAYGNADGCHLNQTGEFVSDDVFLLTPDSFASYATGCDFESLTAIVGPVFSLTASCSSEGEEDRTTDLVRVTDHGTAGYGIQFEGLEEWGPYPACPSADPVASGAQA